MPYEVKIKNNETERDIEMEIEDLKALKEILESFDETKIDVELHTVKINLNERTK